MRTGRVRATTTRCRPTAPTDPSHRRGLSAPAIIAGMIFVGSMLGAARSAAPDGPAVGGADPLAVVSDHRSSPADIVRALASISERPELASGRVAEILRQVDADSEEVRTAAIWCVRCLGKTAEDALESGVRDASSRVRRVSLFIASRSARIPLAVVDRAAEALTDAATDPAEAREAYGVLLRAESAVRSRVAVRLTKREGASDPSEWRRAALWLYCNDRPEALRDLLDALAESSKGLVERASNVCGQLGVSGRVAESALVRVAASSENPSYVRDAALLALRRVRASGPEVLALCRALLADPTIDDPIRSGPDPTQIGGLFATTAVSASDLSVVRERLLSLRGRGGSHAAVIALRSRGAEGEAVLRQAIESNVPIVVRRAAGAFGKGACPSPATLRVLQAGSKVGALEARVACAAAMARCSVFDRTSVSALREGLASQSPLPVQYVALESLVDVKLPQEIVGDLLSLASNPSSRVRLGAIRAVGASLDVDPKIRTLLANLLGDQDLATRLHAAAELARDSVVSDQCVSVLRTGIARAVVAKATVDGLVRVGRRVLDLEPTAREWMRDAGRPYRRWDGVRLLVALGARDPEVALALADLAELSGYEEELLTKDAESAGQYRALELLIAMGRSASPARGTLLRLRDRDPDASVRSMAANALANIGEESK